MAYDVEKLTKLKALKALSERLKSEISAEGTHYMFFNLNKDSEVINR